MQSFWPLVNTCTYTLSVYGRVGYQNKGLDTVACCSEPGGCVSFVTALVRWKPLESCFIMALPEHVPVRWASGALCWPTVAHCTSLPGEAL